MKSAVKIADQVHGEIVPLIIIVFSPIFLKMGLNSVAAHGVLGFLWFYLFWSLQQNRNSGVI